LSYRPPFDWDGLLEFLVHRAIPGVEQIVGGVYRRTIGLDGVAGDLAVSHEPERRRLRVAVNFPRAADLPRIISRVKAMFDLDADPLTIAEALGRDPDMRAKIAARPGLRVPGCWDPFELAVRAILGQQISVAAATRLAGGIARRWGDAYAGEGLDRLFPTAAQLATAEIDGMPGSRARSISSLAAAVAADGAVLAPAADLASAIAHLKRLPGVGDWTAHYIAMRALREPDAFPAADLGLMKAMDLGAGRPDAKSLEAASQAWRPWRAYAALHLWTSPHIKEIPHAVAA
jgi:AraC family transcriptional regulator of adaptative response / DNA-3-methyladenine glycosylase II